MFYSPNQKEESETMEPGGPRLLAIIILLVSVITWTQETLLRSREDFTPRTWNQQHHAGAEADVTEPLTPAELEASLNIHQDQRSKRYVESHHHNLYLKLSHTIATMANKTNCYVCGLIPHSTTGGLPMMAIPLTPCHLLDIAQITPIAFPWCILGLEIILFLLLIHCLKTVISSIGGKSPITQMLNSYDIHNVDEPLNPLTPYMGSVIFLNFP